MARSFTFTARIRSFRYAISGVGIMLRSQHNAWLHALATIGVCAVGFQLGFTRAEWCWIILAIVAVWSAEALNTAFEFLADVASPDFHPVVQKAKDVAAGAVLISAIGSVLIGAVVAAPYLSVLLGGAR